MPRHALAIHGGCGVMAQLDLTEEQWAAARVDLERALRAGWAILDAGGRALDAVEAAVVVMEDSPHFNAGHGATLNAKRYHELEATIMDGRTLAAGAVTLARRIRNPVKAARAVMEGGDAVIMGGEEADAYAQARGLAMVENGYFTTQRRLRALETMQARARAGTTAAASEAEKHGTVGAVALDDHGDLAAATSTGGYNNKPAGRVGDSPIPGAGTYAINGVGAVSGTGKGEVFIRVAAAHEVIARMRYLGEDVRAAAAQVVKEQIGGHGVGAGMVAIDAQGVIAAPYNTDGMFRGWIEADGAMAVATHGQVHDLGRVQDRPKG